jgi:translation initiation factor IF-1
MPREDLVQIEGTVITALGGGQYEIKPTDGSASIRAQLCGKMRKHNIRLILGDKVRVGVSPYDTSHGIVTWKLKS